MYLKVLLGNINFRFNHVGFQAGVEGFDFDMHTLLLKE